MQTIALVIHVFLAAGVIFLVLIQHGKGAEAGAAFGSGASSTVFGSKGSGSFLTRMTTLFALAFFCTSMLLFFLAAKRSSSDIGSVVDGIDTPAVIQQTDVPATEGVPATDTPSLDVPAVDVPATNVPEASTVAPATTETDVPVVPKTE